MKYPPANVGGYFSNCHRQRGTHERPAVCLVPYSACPSMIGPNSCHFSPVNFIIWTCSIG
jgi:hypothetical protein